MRALSSGDHGQISSALRSDPQAARSPFFDFAFEPPIVLAARVGRLDLRVAELLVAHGADVHAVDAHGRTALSYVLGTLPAVAPVADRVLAGMLNSQDCILTCGPMSTFVTGAKTNAGGLRGLARVTSLLISAGADHLSPDLHRVTPLDLAVAAGQQEFARWLQQQALRPLLVAIRESSGKARAHARQSTPQEQLCWQKLEGRLLTHILQFLVKDQAVADSVVIAEEKRQQLGY